MSKPKEPMNWEKEFYNQFTHDWPPAWNYPSTLRSCPASAIAFIRRLIENMDRPGVDEEFMERWAGQIIFLPMSAMEHWSECLPKQLREMLHEAGVRVKEGK